MGYEIGLYVVRCNNPRKRKYMRSGPHSVLCQKHVAWNWLDCSPTPPEIHVCEVLRDMTDIYNMSMEELKETLSERIKKELAINTSTLSRVLAKKISAPDQRTSSQSTGYLAIILLVVVFGLIVLSDVNKLVQCLRKPRRKRRTFPRREMEVNGEKGVDGSPEKPGELGLDEVSEVTDKDVTGFSADEVDETSLNEQTTAAGFSADEVDETSLNEQTTAVVSEPGLQAGLDGPIPAWDASADEEDAEGELTDKSEGGESAGTEAATANKSKAKPKSRRAKRKRPRKPVWKL